ncbi:hypothetical protein ACFE04_001391 [Oxalis oulophora]
MLIKFPSASINCVQHVSKSIDNLNITNNNSITYLRLTRVSSIATGLLAAIVVLASPATAIDSTPQQQKQQQEDSETLSNIPLELSGECDSPNPKDCRKPRIQRPKSRKAETCTVKCLTTCTRGAGGEGPFNIRRPLVVFKQGFRSRRYCLEECSDICNLIGDGDDGP